MPRCQLNGTGITSAGIGWSGCIAPMKVETQISPACEVGNAKPLRR
jgi:hypothetical protein